MTGAQAKDILLRLVANFPGLAGENADEVSGADLVEWMAPEIYALRPDPEIENRAAHGSPDDEEESPSASAATSQRDRLSHLQCEVFAAWKQLAAFGYLLDRQADACEGTPELQGLGLTLRELSDRLHEVWRRLDAVEFSFE